MPPTSSHSISKTEVSPQNKIPDMSNDTSSTKDNSDESVEICIKSDKCLDNTENNNNAEQNNNCDSMEFKNIVDGKGMNSTNKLEKEALEKSISDLKSSFLKNRSANLAAQLRRTPKNITTQGSDSKSGDSHADINGNNDSMKNGYQNGVHDICDNGEKYTTTSSKPVLKEDLVNDIDAYNITGGTINNVEPECFFCGLQNSDEVKLKPCQYCKNVYYCSQTHFEYHRPEDTCFPFIIKHAPGVGRFMVASRDINPLELILKEHPAVVGPYTNTLQGCLQCLRKVDGSYKCSGCGFPMCHEKCEKGPLHQEECKFFQEQHFGLKPSLSYSKLTSRHGSDGSSNKQLLDTKKLFSSKRIPKEASALAAASLTRANAERESKDVNPKTADGSEEDNRNTHPNTKRFKRQIPALLKSSSSHVCITPLRMLLKRKMDPKGYEKIMMLKDHLEERNDKFQQVGIQMLNVVMLLQEACSEPQFTNQEIQRMIGILRTNGMKLLPHGNKGGIQGVALYPIYCLINHACINNTNYVKYPDYHLEVRSQLPIKKGEEIYTRYISSTIGNFRRREDIRKYWFFDCGCNRCSDRTEFGTNMSAVLCLKCKKGYLLPLDPLEYKADWTCDYCQTLTKYEMIDEIITTIEDEVGELTQSNKSILDMERMLHCFSNVLHPSHYILIDIMHNLVHLYAAKKTLSRPEKERKIQLCFNVIDILGIVDPGYTKWRGTLLQELIHPLMQITKRDHDLELISPLEFRRRLDFCTRNLNTAKKCIRGGFTPIEDFIRQQKCASSDVKWETEDFVNAIGNVAIAHKNNSLT